MRGAGQGRRWGRPTTRKETRRVVPKREVVRRERGWRWGGICGWGGLVWLEVEVEVEVEAGVKGGWRGKGDG